MGMAIRIYAGRGLSSLLGEVVDLWSCVFWEIFSFCGFDGLVIRLFVDDDDDNYTEEEVQSISTDKYFLFSQPWDGQVSRQVSKMLLVAIKSTR